MIYVGAVEGSSTALVPRHVYRMTEEQAGCTSPQDRLNYVAASKKPGFRAPGVRWYADNSREPIRDETLREGLVPNNAVLIDSKAVTTANVGRYVLKKSFCSLFDPALTGSALERTIAKWRQDHLSKAALAKTLLLRQGTVAAKEKMPVRLPNGTVRNLSPGLSSAISKAVVEEFAPRFLENPAVLWISESGNKVVEQDNTLAQAVGITIEPDKLLPDLILIDLAPREPLFVFVEVVASDGPVTETRKNALLAIATEGGFDPANVTFVTAFADRDRPEFKKSVGAIAPDTFAWSFAEPDLLLWFKTQGDEKPEALSRLLHRPR